MKTPAQRQQTIDRLEQLRTKLSSFTTDRTLLRELPPELLATVKQEPLIGTVTSSGIERISSILIHLGWVIMFLKDPNFPYPPKSAKTATASTSSAVGLAHETPAMPTPPPPKPVDISTPDALDFGPFNPKP